MEETAKKLNVTLLPARRAQRRGADRGLAGIAKESVDAVAVVEDIVLIQNHRRIAQAAIAQRLPSISFLEYAEEGGLFGYGANYLALYRRAPVFVDKILKGAKPADIPIERPTTFEFVVNLKTARRSTLRSIRVPAANGSKDRVKPDLDRGAGSRLGNRRGDLDRLDANLLGQLRLQRRELRRGLDV
jgi:ABC-type uncharacterized transport system substrate-binding protein